jgi:hypothetical protein
VISLVVGKSRQRRYGRKYHYFCFWRFWKMDSNFITMSLEDAMMLMTGRYIHNPRNIPKDYILKILIKYGFDLSDLERVREAIRKGKIVGKKSKNNGDGEFGL